MSMEQVNRLAQHCNFKNFKKNESVNGKNYLPAKNGSFIRKGQVGDWMNHFKDQDKLREFDQWIAENNKFEIPFRYEM